MSKEKFCKSMLSMGCQCPLSYKFCKSARMHARVGGVGLDIDRSIANYAYSVNPSFNSFMAPGDLS